MVQHRQDTLTENSFETIFREDMERNLLVLMFQELLQEIT